MKTRILSTARLSFPLASAIAALLAASSTQAASIYWDGTSASWNTKTNWSTASGADTPNPVDAPGAADDAFFNISTVNDPETITLGANQAVSSVTFNNTGTTTLTGGGTARTLTLGTGGIAMDSVAGAVTLGSGAAGNNVLLNLSGAQTWTNNSANDFTINNTAATFTRQTGATLLFNKASSGNFAISTTVAPLVNTIIGPWAFFGTGANQKYAVSGTSVTGKTGTTATNVNSMTSATANYEYTKVGTTYAGASNLTANTIRTSLANTISLSVSSGAAYDLYLNGILATAASGTFTISKSTSSDPTRGLQIGSFGELVIAGQQAVTISAPIHGAYKGLTYSGSNTLILSGVNTYTGATTVSSGILSLGNSLALQNSPLNTNGSIVGDSSNGLKTALTALTLGGLTGNKDLASLFTTTDGVYGNVTNLTLNPVTGASHSYSGIIADGAAGMTLTKTGSGTQSLAGVNSYTGGTTVNAGALSFLNPNAIPASGTHSFAAETTLGLGVSGANAFSAADIENAFSGSMTGNLDGIVIDATTRIGLDTTLGNVTFSGSITGSPARDLVKLGGNILTLSGTTTHTGTTTILGGSLGISNLSALGNTSGITIKDGGTLVPNLDGFTISVPITLDSTGTTSTINAPTTGASGAVQTLTINNTISGDGDLTFNGSNGDNSTGTIVLGAANTYTGDTLIDCTAAGATCFLVSGATDALPPTTVLTIDGGAGSGSGRTLRYDLNGFDQTLAGLTYVRQIARNQRVTNTGAPATLTINNASDYAFGDVFNFTFNAVPKTTLTRIEGAISLVKSGVGTFTLKKGHTYTGTTAVNEGTLGLNGASLTSDVTVAGGASIKFTLGAPATTTGSLGLGTGTVKIDGTVANAADYKLMTATGKITGSLTLDSGINDYELELRNGDSELWLAYVAPGGYSVWASLNGAGVDLAADHDNDGVANGIEYFLGGPNGNTTGFTALPGVVSTAGALSVTWPKGAGYDGTYGTHFWIETSPSLTAASWTQQTVPMGNVTDDPGFVKITFPAGTKNFARLVVIGL